MNQPTKDSTRRTSADSTTTSVKNPGRTRPLASGHHPPILKSFRQSTVSRFGIGGRIHASPAELGPPALVLREHLLVHVGAIHTSSSMRKTGSPDVRSTPRLRCSIRARRVDVVERQSCARAELLDLRTRRRRRSHRRRRALSAEPSARRGCGRRRGGSPAGSGSRSKHESAFRLFWSAPPIASSFDVRRERLT